MYQPGHGRFRVRDPRGQLLALLEVSPATLVTRGPDGFRASILPMLLDPEPAPHGSLRGHLARGNPQWREIEAELEANLRDAPDGVPAMALFDGPDAYISPTWYEEKRRTGEVVPTWNYVTVQVHGTLLVHHEPEWLRPHVAALVARHESGRPEPWSLEDAPEPYVASQLRAIVGLELRIDRIEAKRKLSQNRSAADVDGAIEGLALGGPAERAVADEMRREPKP
ncbi:MAG TPA: FMN-binding negative transcriptional regulator [Candidatus Limnocylindrales bacterium]|nr:FMN-binding negative transcriptional regulator [Candidatus Limnocylindrales bacterium]